MQALCGLQGIFDLFNCKTPVFHSITGSRFVKILLIFFLLFTYFKFQRPQDAQPPPKGTNYCNSADMRI